MCIGSGTMNRYEVDGSPKIRNSHRYYIVIVITIRFLIYYLFVTGEMNPLCFLSWTWRLSIPCEINFVLGVYGYTYTFRSNSPFKFDMVIYYYLRVPIITL